MQTSLEAPPPRGGTKKQPRIYAQPLRSDTAYQRRMHRLTQADRRERVAKLLDVADRNPPDQLDAIHPARRIANKLTSCGRHPTIYQDSDSGRIVLSHARCKSRVCPHCAGIRRKQLRDRVSEAVKHIDDARMLTLTLAASDDPLADQLHRLKEAFKKLRRLKSWRAHVTGGVYLVEITFNAASTQWHPHLHCIVDGCYWAQAEIANAWETATGDSRIVDIRRVPSRKALVQYVTKYVAKSETPPNMPAPKLAEWATALHGARQMQTFGALHGKAVAPHNEPDHGELDHVAPGNALPDSADRGDHRAARLWACLGRLVSHRVPDDDPIAAARVLARHRRLARRIRAWWSNQQGENHRHDPDRPPNQPARGDPHHRALRLWQEPEPPPRV